MITLKNFSSGEIEISNEEAPSIRLTHDQANRLVMYARMHTVAGLVESLPRLIPSEPLVGAIRTLFEQAKSSSDRWNLKEKFARLRTISSDVPALRAAEIVETVHL